MEADLAAGMPLFALVTRVGLTPSNSEARRLIKGQGARLNDSVVADEKYSITLRDLNPDGMLKLSAGKKRHALVRPT